ncbi:uncharacterized protein LOC101168767 isoform X2 [Oryzias latipes]|uniref:uncharacterized protein LOC101168767 isoform X2 n=1 Tax=Oryzias latipes TaxID=8090 RepID=UPI0005CBD134|nr:uncharacterized protein LOC101168767 isoform X2 [Oryzias latipes]
MQPQQFSKERGLFGKLSPGKKKLEGKTFYLDNVKKHSAALLLEAVYLLGGKIESFLHKDVSFVVTGSQERLKAKNGVEIGEGAKGLGEGTQRLMTEQKSSAKLPTKKPRSMACVSRGKALLEKAIRNNERLRGSSVLSDAQSWGVKILYVDDVLICLKQLSRESFSPKHKRIEISTKQRQPAVRAAPLRSPYLKIEDVSRRYRPLHVQSMTLPALFYSGRHSPFEAPPPPQFDKQPDRENSKSRVKKIGNKAQDKSPVGVFCSPSPWRPRKKDNSYCECCCETFTNLEEHLLSDQHRSFVLNPFNYRTVDQLVAEMSPGFDPRLAEETSKRPTTPLPLDAVCELEPLTDAEMERAVRALQRQGSSLTAGDTSPTGRPLFCGPPSPGPVFTFENEAAPPTFHPEVDRQCPDLLQPRASSPVMPVLTPEPRVGTAYQQTEKPSSDCSATGFSWDPYALPPVLSPQIPYSLDTMEQQRSPDSEPPVLSPQRFSTVETVGELTYEMNVPHQTLPQSSPVLSVDASNPGKRVLFRSDGLFGFNSSLRPAAQTRRWSNSVPRQSPITPNPKKRCRSASPVHMHRKRRRTASFGDSGQWSELSIKDAKPQRDSVAVLRGWVSFDSVSHGNLNNPFSMFTASSCVPLKNSSQGPNHIDSGRDQLSWLLSSKAAICDGSDGPNAAASSLPPLYLSTSISIEPGLIPDPAELSPSSSDSDWDCNLLARLNQTPAPAPSEHSCAVDAELLHRPCPWMHDTSYESHLHTVLPPLNPAASACGEDVEPSAFSRTLVQVVEVQH